MKKFIIFITILFACISIFAQDNTNNDNVIYLDVPAKMKINDKIFLVNNSPYTVLQAVVVLVESKKTIGSTVYVNPGRRSEMASYGDNGLKNVRGKRIAIKIKGVKIVLDDTSSTGVVGGSMATGTFGVGTSRLELKADEINNIDPSLITYNFSASIAEEDHDLYITITSGSTKDPFDF